MKDEGRELIEAMHREAVERCRGEPLPPIEGPTIPCTELPELDRGSPLSEEWDTYRRSVTQLLAEGHQGEFVLIKGAAVVGFFESWDAARKAGLQRYLPDPFLVHQIQTRETLLRLRAYSLPCHS